MRARLIKDFTIDRAHGYGSADRGITWVFPEHYGPYQTRAVLYSNEDYGCESDYDWRNQRYRTEDNTRFAVNVIVYAMAA